MGEATARALGAASSKTIMVAGKECRVRPLSIRELTEAERECLSCYRRSYVKMYVETADLFPDGMSRAEKARDVAARWDISDLPSKWAYDSASIKVTTKLAAFLAAELKIEEAITDEKARRLASGLLDQETMTEEQVLELTGVAPRKVQIPYVNWWITGCFDGMVTFIWLCFRPSGVTKDDVIEEMAKNPALLVELSREIEHLSTPSVGNG